MSTRFVKTSCERTIRHEIKIHLHVQTRPDFGSHVCGFNWNRCRSIDWASHRFKRSERWQEFGCCPSDRWQNSGQYWPGQPVQSFSVDRASRIVGLGRVYTFRPTPSMPTVSGATSTVVNVRRGRTYVFTASRRWGSNNLVLVPQGRH